MELSFPETVSSNMGAPNNNSQEIERLKFEIQRNGTMAHTNLYNSQAKRGRKQTMDGHDSEDPKQSTADMTAFVQNLLQQMQSRFQNMSENIVSKIDEMGSRINELEQSINELRTEIGVEGSPSPCKQNSSDAKEEEHVTS